MKNYVTVLNHKYLPQLLALYESMNQHCGDFNLFVVCIDELLFSQLTELNLKQIVLLDLESIEKKNVRLAKIKTSRTFREYCWTLASFSFSLVKDQYPDIEELTYIDADIYFFSSPEQIIAEFERSGKSVLITEHAYAPEYQFISKTAGLFCVQFISVKFCDASMKVIKEWQDLCEECCCEEPKDGKFGDQKYLDEWPEKYSDTVHILEQKNLTQAPWNINEYSTNPVFYHFHGFRLISPSVVTLFQMYEVAITRKCIYSEYVQSIRKQLGILRKHKIVVPFFSENTLPLLFLRKLKWHMFHKTLYRYETLR